jgi:TrkA domain protein
LKIKIADLPGIGKKLTFLPADASKIVLVIHHTGKREMYFFQDADDDEADFSINLTAEETREMGAQLLGATYQPTDIDKMKLFKKQIVMEWVEVKGDSPLVGKTIGESRIRTKTGVSIIGIIRGEEVVASPGIDVVIQSGDTLMAVGKSEQIDQFTALSNGEGV